MYTKIKSIISKFSLKNFLYLSIAIIILTNAIIQIQINKNYIKEKLRKYVSFGKEENYLKRDPLSDNPLIKSNRQPPQIDYKSYKTEMHADVKGFWSAPFDYNMSLIHSALLQDGTVFGYGTLSVKNFEGGDKDIVENKKVVLSNNYQVGRDNGDHQWAHHDVQTGVDFDVWDISKGFGQDSHTIYERPLKYDSFCSILRIYDENLVFLLGGNRQDPHPDWQKGTAFFNIKNKNFTHGPKLHYPRWYGSIVRLEDDTFLMLGGGDITKRKVPDKFGIERAVLPSPIPELLVKDQNNSFSWIELKHLESNTFFGRDDEDEWHYPRSYLISDGSIAGIAYDKIWKIEKDLSSVNEVGRIPLVKDNIKIFLSKEYKNPKKTENKDLEITNSVLGTLSSAVGHTSSSVMIGKDKIFQMGGVQIGEFLASNHSNLIDFSDSNNPKVIRKADMKYPRSWHNSLILADGNVFVNGGYLKEDNEFSWYEPEIYNVEKNEWITMKPAHFRRNYHSSSLLLPDGSVLVGGSDMWNAEIFYPPYLFENAWGSKPVFAKRPEILNIENLLTNRGKQLIKTDNTSSIQKITLISNGSGTHSQNSELKVIYPKFERIDDTTISYEIDLNKNYVQDGSYLLFLVNNKGTPSIGEVITIKSSS